MHRNQIFFAGLVLALASQPSFAGPPLICHPLDIGSEKSLPWSGGDNWDSRDPGYDRRNLISDTLALLSPGTPALVRMETLRRAALYSREDSALASELLASLMARALDAEAGGKSDAFAWFDAGYLAESYRQLSMTQTRKLAAGLSGYKWVQKSIHLGGEKAAFEFAASLMTKGSWPNEHYRRAVAGAAEGSLLARNLVRYRADSQR